MAIRDIVVGPRPTTQISRLPAGMSREHEGHHHQACTEPEHEPEEAEVSLAPAEDAGVASADLLAGHDATTRLRPPADGAPEGHQLGLRPEAVGNPESRLAVAPDEDVIPKGLTPALADPDPHHPLQLGHRKHLDPPEDPGLPDLAVAEAQGAVAVEEGPPGPHAGDLRHQRHQRQRQQLRHADGDPDQGDGHHQHDQREHRRGQQPRL
ncbi:MAG TPA: hypothetical protein VG245_04470, partial [Candidatus Dormibacteraeota bacterium]|nr:hypothetical protein [Candidatus Dormibacteraeota bacterium]